MSRTKETSGGASASSSGGGELRAAGAVASQHNSSSSLPTPSNSDIDTIQLFAPRLFMDSQGAGATRFTDTRAGETNAAIDGARVDDGADVLRMLAETPHEELDGAFGLRRWITNTCGLEFVTEGFDYIRLTAFTRSRWTGRYVSPVVARDFAHFQHGRAAWAPIAWYAAVVVAAAAGAICVAGGGAGGERGGRAFGLLVAIAVSAGVCCVMEIAPSLLAWRCAARREGQGGFGTNASPPLPPPPPQQQQPDGGSLAVTAQLVVGRGDSGSNSASPTSPLPQQASQAALTTNAHPRCLLSPVHHFHLRTTTFFLHSLGLALLLHFLDVALITECKRAATAAGSGHLLFQPPHADSSGSDASLSAAPSSARTESSEGDAVPGEGCCGQIFVWPLVLLFAPLLLRAPPLALTACIVVFSIGGQVISRVAAGGEGVADASKLGYKVSATVALSILALSAKLVQEGDERRVFETSAVLAATISAIHRRREQLLVAVALELPLRLAAQVARGAAAVESPRGSVALVELIDIATAAGRLAPALTIAGLGEAVARLRRLAAFFDVDTVFISGDLACFTLGLLQTHAPHQSTTCAVFAREAVETLFAKSQTISRAAVGTGMVQLTASGVASLHAELAGKGFHLTRTLLLHVNPRSVKVLALVRQSCEAFGSAFPDAAEAVGSVTFAEDEPFVLCNGQFEPTFRLTGHRIGAAFRRGDAQCSTAATTHRRHSRNNNNSSSNSSSRWASVSPSAPQLPVFPAARPPSGGPNSGGVDSEGLLTSATMRNFGPIAVNFALPPAAAAAAAAADSALASSAQYASDGSASAGAWSMNSGAGGAGAAAGAAPGEGSPSALGIPILHESVATCSNSYMAAAMPPTPSTPQVPAALSAAGVAEHAFVVGADACTHDAEVPPTHASFQGAPPLSVSSKEGAADADFVDSIALIDDDDDCDDNNGESPRGGGTGRGAATTSGGGTRYHGSCRPLIEFACGDSASFASGAPADSPSSPVRFATRGDVAKTTDKRRCETRGTVALGSGSGTRSSWSPGSASRCVMDDAVDDPDADPVIPVVAFVAGFDGVQPRPQAPEERADGAHFSERPSSAAAGSLRASVVGRAQQQQLSQPSRTRSGSGGVGSTGEEWFNSDASSSVGFTRRVLGLGSAAAIAAPENAAAARVNHRCALLLTELVRGMSRVRMPAPSTASPLTAPSSLLPSSAAAAASSAAAAVGGAPEGAQRQSSSVVEEVENDNIEKEDAAKDLVSGAVPVALWMSSNLFNAARNVERRAACHGLRTSFALPQTEAEFELFKLTELQRPFAFSFGFLALLFVVLVAMLHQQLDGDVPWDVYALSMVLAGASAIIALLANVISARLFIRTRVAFATVALLVLLLAALVGALARPSIVGNDAHYLVLVAVFALQTVPLPRALFAPIVTLMWPFFGLMNLINTSGSGSSSGGVAFSAAVFLPQAFLLTLHLERAIDCDWRRDFATSRLHDAFLDEYIVDGRTQRWLSRTSVPPLLPMAPRPAQQSLLCVATFVFSSSGDATGDVPVHIAGAFRELDRIVTEAAARSLCPVTILGDLLVAAGPFAKPLQGGQATGNTRNAAAAVAEEEGRQRQQQQPAAATGDGESHRIREVRGCARAVTAAVRVVSHLAAHFAPRGTVFAAALTCGRCTWEIGSVCGSLRFTAAGPAFTAGRLLAVAAPPSYALIAGECVDIGAAMLEAALAELELGVGEFDTWQLKGLEPLQVAPLLPAREVDGGFSSGPL